MPTTFLATNLIVYLATFGAVTMVVIFILGLLKAWELWQQLRGERRKRRTFVD